LIIHISKGSTSPDDHHQFFSVEAPKEGEVCTQVLELNKIKYRSNRSLDKLKERNFFLGVTKLFFAHAYHLKVRISLHQSMSSSAKAFHEFSDCLG
jgi:hypothetical protein